MKGLLKVIGFVVWVFLSYKLGGLIGWLMSQPSDIAFFSGVGLGVVTLFLYVKLGIYMVNRRLE